MSANKAKKVLLHFWQMIDFHPKLQLSRQVSFFEKTQRLRFSSKGGKRLMPTMLLEHFLREENGACVTFFFAAVQLITLQQLPALYLKKKSWSISKCVSLNECWICQSLIKKWVLACLKCVTLMRGKTALKLAKNYLVSLRYVSRAAAC